MYIPKTIASFQDYGFNCICQKPSCKRITQQFQKLDDYRGQYVKVPNPKGITQKNTNKKLLETWRSRLCIHFNINYTDFNMDLCYNRTEDEQTAKKDANIATWHFHPSILNHVINETKSSPNDDKKFYMDKCILIGTVKSLGLYQAEGGNAYSRADACVKGATLDTDKIVLVPTYVNKADVDADIKKAEKAKHEFDSYQKALQSPSTTPSRTLRKRKTSTPTSSPSTQTSPPLKKSKHACVDPTNGTNEILQLKDEQEMKRMNHDNLIAYVMKLQDEIKSKCEVENELATLRSVVAIQDAAKDVELKELREKLIKANEENANVAIEELKKCGLNRLSMSNVDFLSKHDNHVNELYGFPNYDFMKGFIETVLEVPFTEPTKGLITTSKDGSLSDFEQILLTLLYANTIHSYSVIGSIFGISARNTVTKYIDRWLPVLGETGDMMSSFMNILDADAIDELEPIWYKKMGLRQVASIVDGKDFMTETFRTDRVLNCAQASGKTKHSSFRLLTWSLPCGAVIERTPTFLARASEKAILKAWGDTGRLILPPGYSVLGDKGFDNTASSYTNYNTTLHPSFLTNRSFSRGQVNHNLIICQKRYTGEVVYSRVTATTKLKGVFPREHFHNFEFIVGWAHGRANLCYGPLQKLEDSDDDQHDNKDMESVASQEGSNDDDDSESSEESSEDENEDESDEGEGDDLDSSQDGNDNQDSSHEDPIEKRTRIENPNESVLYAVVKATQRKRDEMKAKLSETIDFSKISLHKLAKDQDMSKE